MKQCISVAGKKKSFCGNSPDEDSPVSSFFILESYSCCKRDAWIYENKNGSQGF